LVHETFWPYFPFFIPNLPGIASWWDIFWWAFQLVVMGAVLIGLRHLGLRVDEANDRYLPAALRAKGQPAPAPRDRGPAVPG
jgi:hypothetical protein